MKKITLFTIIVLLSFMVVPTAVSAKTSEPITVTANPAEVPENVQIMLNRLDEIKAMDKSTLTSSEKRALRKEVRAIRSNLYAAGNHGLYLSVGAIIIIILLLILIL